MPEDYKFCAAVAGFGMLLRNSVHKGSTDLNLVLLLSQQGKGADLEGYRDEFINIVRKYGDLK